MKASIFLVLLLAGCSQSPAPSVANTPAASPTVPTTASTPVALAPEFQKLHEHFQTRTVPAFRQLYEAGAKFLRADAPTEARQDAAKQLEGAFEQGVDEVRRELLELNKIKPAAAPEPYRAAFGAQMSAWKTEAEVYQRYVKAMRLKDPTKDPDLQQTIKDLEFKAVARVHATEEVQKAYDRVFGSEGKLTRPATVSAF